MRLALENRPSVQIVQLHEPHLFKRSYGPEHATTGPVYVIHHNYTAHRNLGRVPLNIAHGLIGMTSIEMEEPNGIRRCGVIALGAD